MTNQTRYMRASLLGLMLGLSAIGVLDACIGEGQFALLALMTAPGWIVVADAFRKVATR
jgi:ubiquinone/menaquinone biosynthesis C-methylase UbiE